MYILFCSSKFWLKSMWTFLSLSPKVAKRDAREAGRGSSRWNLQCWISSFPHENDGLAEFQNKALPRERCLQNATKKKRPASPRNNNNNNNRGAQTTSWKGGRVDARKNSTFRPRFRINKVDTTDDVYGLSPSSPSFGGKRDCEQFARASPCGHFNAESAIRPKSVTSP